MTPRLILLCGLLSTGVSVTAERADLLVVEKKNNAVGFYTSSGSRAADVQLGQTPHEMVLSGDGRFDNVSDHGVLWMDYDGLGGHTLAIVDLKLRRRHGVFPLGKFYRLHGIAADPRSSRAFVTSENQIGIVSVRERNVVQVIDTPPGSGPDPVLEIGTDTPPGIRP